MTKFLDLFLGKPDIPTYLAGLLFALFGMFMHYKQKVKKRNAYSKNTPFKFSWSFFAQDNLVDLTYSLLVVFLSLRFSVEIAGAQVTMFYAFGIGFGLPKVIAAIYRIQSKSRIK